jgi:hypothetical protein
MRHTSFLRIGFLWFASAAFVACGGSTDTGGDNGGGDTGGSGADTAGGGDTSTNGDSSVGTDTTSTDTTPSETADDTSTGADGDAPPVCSAEATRAKCQDCCAAEHKEGAKTFDTALVACACTDGICKTDCATTACATPAAAPDALCKACLAASVKSPGDAGPPDAPGPDGKCNAPVASACSADARCVAYVTCLGTCPGG